MTRHTSHRRAAVAVLVGALSGACAEPAEHIYGARVTDLEFELCDPTMGIHPSQAVLNCDANPFVAGVGAETKWRVQTAGGPVAAFYAWATALATQPTGEHQYYAAAALKAVYLAAEADQDDLETVRLMAVAGYQSVLDQFPESISFDDTGTIPFRLATPAYRGIVELGERPRGGWVLVPTSDAGEQAVHIGQDEPAPTDTPTTPAGAEIP